MRKHACLSSGICGLSGGANSAKDAVWRWFYRPWCRYFPSSLPVVNVLCKLACVAFDVCFILNPLSHTVFSNMSTCQAQTHVQQCRQYSTFKRSIITVDSANKNHMLYALYISIHSWVIASRTVWQSSGSSSSFSTALSSGITGSGLRVMQSNIPTAIGNVCIV